MLQDYTKLSEEELDDQMESLRKKIHQADAMGHASVVEQLLFHLENMQMEFQDRMERMRFDLIQGRTPESLIVGEEPDEPDASTDN
jgi:hypothetical protein